MSWDEIPGQLTSAALKRLTSAFKLSGNYYSRADRDDRFLVGRQGKEEEPLAIVITSSNGKLTCQSCFHINLFGCPCPHVLATARIFRASENYLPFLERSFRTRSGPFTTLSTLFPTDECSIPMDIPVEEDVIGIDKILENDSNHDDREDTDHVGDFPSDIHEDIQCPDFFPRESTRTIKEREAVQRGKKAQQPRKWLLEHVLYPRLKEAVFQREQFERAYFGTMKFLDDFERSAHTLFPAQSASKEASTIRTIGYDENLKSSNMIQPTHRNASGKRKQSSAIERSQRPENADKKARTAPTRKEKPKAPPQYEQKQADNQNKWEVEEFRKFNSSNNTVLVKWKNYDELSWEPLLNLRDDLGDFFKTFWDPLEDTLSVHVALQVDKLLDSM
jgi:hypothetical protein